MTAAHQENRTMLQAAPTLGRPFGRVPAPIRWPRLKVLAVAAALAALCAALGGALAMTQLLGAMGSPAGSAVGAPLQPMPTSPLAWPAGTGVPDASVVFKGREAEIDEPPVPTF